MPGELTAAAIYGAAGRTQPSPTPGPDTEPGEAEPTGRTEPRPSGPLGDPVLVLVGLIGLAVLLVQVSIRGTVAVGVAT